MNDVDEIYKRLARDCPAQELAARYATARDHGARAIKNPRPTFARALPLVAIALPPAPRWTSPSTCFTCSAPQLKAT